jgi:hypothetical protein
MTTTARTPKQVIDQAIRENRYAEYLCYGFAICFATVGVVGFFILVIAGQPVLTIASGIASILFWPALSNAREIRKENIANRLLEVPLGLATNEESAAKALEKVFLSTLNRERGKK